MTVSAKQKPITDNYPNTESRKSKAFIMSKDMIRVTVPLMLIVSGLKVELIYENIGGHPSIKVVCDQYRDRYFRIDSYRSIVAGDEYLTFLAKDICIYIHTGRHPMDPIKPDPKSFIGKSLERATHIVRQAVEQELVGSQELIQS